MAAKKVAKGTGDCAACLASRRTTVDAFFLGYVAGQRDAVADYLEERGRFSAVLDRAEFCLVHDKMACERLAEMLKAMKGEGHAG